MIYNHFSRLIATQETYVGLRVAKDVSDRLESSFRDDSFKQDVEGFNIVIDSQEIKIVVRLNK